MQLSVAATSSTIGVQKSSKLARKDSGYIGPSGDDVPPTAAATISSGGWHLKSRILNPFTGWFKSSKPQGSVNHPSVVVVSECDENTRSTQPSYVAYACNDENANVGGSRKKGTAAVSMPASTISPLYLTAPTQVVNNRAATSK